MTKVNISIESNGLNTTQASNLSAFLTSLGSDQDVKSVEDPINLPADELVEEKPKATRNRSKKVEAPAITETEQEEVNNIEAVEAEEVKPAAEEPAEEEDDLMGEDAKPAISIVEIRAKVSEKQADFKEQIRGKLKDFGAANVTALEEKNYAAFYDFLNGLK